MALFASSAAARALARGKLPLDATVVAAATWAVACAVAPAVDCVLITRAPPDELGIGALALAIALAAPATPIVICAEPAAREHAELERVGVASVVPPGASARLLWGTVQSAVSAALMARTVERLGEVRLPQPLRDALVELCAAGRPPHSVAALCERIGVHRHTLWYQWRGRARAATPRLEDVVTTVLLLRAFTWRVSGGSWSEVAARAEVHRHTLARGARRLLALRSLPPRTGPLADAANAAARRAFIENVVHPVLRRQMP